MKVVLIRRRQHLCQVTLNCIHLHLPAVTLSKATKEATNQNQEYLRYSKYLRHEQVQLISRSLITSSYKPNLSPEYPFFSVVYHEIYIVETSTIDGVNFSLKVLNKVNQKYLFFAHNLPL